MSFHSRPPHGNVHVQLRWYVYGQQPDDQQKVEIYQPSLPHDTRLHNKGIINLNYISTEHNTADNMTKTLYKVKYRYLTNKFSQFRGTILNRTITRNY